MKKEKLRLISAALSLVATISVTSGCSQTNGGEVDNTTTISDDINAEDFDDANYLVEEVPVTITYSVDGTKAYSVPRGGILIGNKGYIFKPKIVTREEMMEHLDSQTKKLVP